MRIDTQTPFHIDLTWWSSQGRNLRRFLASIIPGAQGWPTFHRNRSEQFEARFAMVEIVASPSIFFAGMAGSKLPVVVSHGEGRVAFRDPAHAANARPAMCYVDNRGMPTETYPANPNGSPGGASALGS